MVYDIWQDGSRKTDHRLGASQIGCIAASVAAIAEVQALFKVRNDGGVDAGGLQDGGRALDAFAAPGVQIGQVDPHQFLYIIFDYDDVRNSRSV